jgi:dihydroxyacetone kinase-like protein
MHHPQIEAILTSVAEAVIAHADELTALDQAIGDGDHGLNMKRGFEAVLAELPKVRAQPLPEALKTVGTTLVMKVGGASGPLYGTLFLALGKAIAPEPTYADAVAAFGTAIEAVKARGKSDAGQKTMLDVLVPVHAALAATAGDFGGTIRPAVAAVAADSAQATISMKAIRGRASFLGDRSVGHMDPGARSSQIMIDAALRAFGGQS